MAKTKALAFPPLSRWPPLFPRTFAIPCLKTGDKCREPALLFDESSPRLCPHNSPEQCRFYLEGAAEARASAPENAPPVPCRIAKSPAAGCRPARLPAEKSFSARQGASGSPCARKTFLCAHMGRSRNAPSQWPCLPSRLRFFSFLQLPPSKHVNTAAAHDAPARAAPVESLPDFLADSRSIIAST